MSVRSWLTATRAFGLARRLYEEFCSVAFHRGVGFSDGIVEDCLGPDRAGRWWSSVANSPEPLAARHHADQVV